jgi:hypothetical protein
MVILGIGLQISKLLFTTLSQFTLTSMIINLPNKNKIGFLIGSLIFLFVSFISTIYITYQILMNKIHLRHEHILLLVSIIILAYSSTYYSLYNYNKEAFTWSHDSLDKRIGNTYEDMFKSWFDMLYFTITTFYLGGLGDIVPRSRLARSIVVSQLILAISVILIIINKVI